MTFEQRKLLILSSWIAVVATAGILITIETPALWMAVASLALIPPAVVNWFWIAPEMTLAPVANKNRR